MLLVPLLLVTTALPAETSFAESPFNVRAQEPAAEAEPWSLSLETYWTEPPEESGYLSGILSADRDRLHLEARWAYEGRDTASLFAGWSCPWEGEVSGSVTPMIGAAFGDTDGIVPALSIETSWKQLGFTSDLEYLIATSDESDDFFYSWSELTWSPTEHFVVGLVGQRTNVFDQELTIDRGFLAGVAFGQAWLTVYVFNPDQDDPYVTVSFGAGF